MTAVSPLRPVAVAPTPQVAALPPGSTESSKTRLTLRFSFVGLLPVVGITGLVFLADLLLTTRLATSVVLAAIVGMMIVDAVTARKAVERLRLWVEPVGDATVDRPITFGLHVANVGRPVRLVQPSSRSSASAYVIDRDGRNELTLPPAPRGIQRLVYLDVIARGWFGLTERRRRYRCWLTRPLVIAPPELAHPVGWPALQASVTGEANSTTRGDDLFRSVRDYRPGDPPRHVHWPASAHHGQLMVRELDGRGSYRLRIVVNLPFPGPRSEAALGRAHWLAREAIRRGWSVELHTIERVYGPPLPGPLLKAIGPVPVTPLDVGPVQVAQGQVDSSTLRLRLASASFGYVPEPPHDMLTRVLTPDGDLWL